MIKYIESKTVKWLKNKLINRDCGIIFESQSLSSFDHIQSFIEGYDRPFYTSIIYYQAFPAESTSQFMDTLRDELTSKLGNRLVNQKKSLLNIIRDAGMKMILIHDCHLHPQSTLEKLLKLFSDCQVSVILVGDRQKMEISQILSHPTVSQWDNLELDLMVQI